MQYKAVIFDMDGLLIDSEPQWQEAGRETIRQFGYELSEEAYNSSTGLRTEEWIEHWFRHFGINMVEAPQAVNLIIEKAIDKIDRNGHPLPGVDDILSFFRKREFRIGLATSSPHSLVDVVLRKLDLAGTFDAIASAGDLPYGKPHPQVYLDCAASLGCPPIQCIAFEDSYYGMIAAKAARMKCVVVPHPGAYDHPKWSAADLKLARLDDFTDEHLQSL